jgi:sugar phosphate isomerase/epimerase
MEFALSTHLFHGERLIRAHFETISALGFNRVELFATRTHFDYHDPTEVDRIGRWLSELGIVAGSMHAPICASFVRGQWGRSYSNAAATGPRRQEAIEETRAAMEAARLLGCESMVVHLGLPREQTIPPGDNDAGAVRRSLEQLAAIASSSGVRLALEVIPNDLSTPDALVAWLEDEVELDDAGICLDFGHAHLLGGAPEAVEALAGHVICTHVHDNRGVADDHLVPFAGTIDWATTLAALWKIGYNGPLVFEVADHGDATGVLQRTVGARTRLQAILDGLSTPFEFSEGD